MNIKTRTRAQFDAIREGEVIECDFNKGETYITLDFELDDVVTEVKYEIDWTSDQDGFKYDLTACDAIYYKGMKKVVIEDLWRDHKELAEIAQTKATDYIDLVGALDQEQFDREEDAQNYWGDF